MEIGGIRCDVRADEPGQVADERRRSRIDGYHLAVCLRRNPHGRRGRGHHCPGRCGGMLFADPRGAGAASRPGLLRPWRTEPTVTDRAPSSVASRPAPMPAARSPSTWSAPARDRQPHRRAARHQHRGSGGGLISAGRAASAACVERISVQRGFNPAGFTLVPAGGAGPLHGSERRRRCWGRSAATSPASRRLLRPWACCNRMSGRTISRSSCAISTGMSRRPLWTASRNCAPAHPTPSPAKASPAITPIPGARSICRYRGQQSDLRVELPDGDDFRSGHWCAGCSKPNMPASSRHIQPGGAIQITSLSMAGFYRPATALEAATGSAEQGEPATRATRRVWFPVAGGIPRSMTAPISRRAS